MCMEGWSGRGWGKGEGLEFHVPQQHLFVGFPYLSLFPPPRLWMASVIFQLILGWVTGSHGDSEGSCRANTETKWKVSMHRCKYCLATKFAWVLAIHSSYYRSYNYAFQFANLFWHEYQERVQGMDGHIEYSVITIIQSISQQ